ncbi:MAG: 4-alpha-glucanotransferase [Parachlamydia sp.]|nr:MAG: 4-alpha-glucanotransferase [Parachlamydia sp.]
MNEQHLLQSPACQHWQKIGIHAHHGICVPVFSLHSETSGGIGEFTDLIPLIDWCRNVGLDIIQTLPLNDTGLETSPYSALSAFALNPIHLGLVKLPYYADYPQLADPFAAIHALLKEQRIPYPKLHQLRDTYLRTYYALAGAEIVHSEAFQIFKKSNTWVQDYALFKAIKIQRNWTSFTSWPEDVRSPTPETLAKLAEEMKDEVAYHVFLQFLCDEQMREIKEYAEKQKVFLMGDIPILINAESADVWLHPELFNQKLTAGAPPDQYSAEGQNWGFPLYNWDKNRETNYAWWKKRLEIATRYYHLFRIDHVVGFYRIWGVPFHALAKEGRFIPENPATWIGQGEQILRMMLESCPMLPIGEDLGVIPPEVRTNLLALGICGTKVMRWERVWNEDRRFIRPQDYIPESLTTVSTHDSETLQLWWQNHPDEAQDFCRFKEWDYETPLSVIKHQDILFDSHQTSSLFHINLLQEYLALFPDLTWPNLEDERINIPGLVLDRNWSYRFRPSIEEIVRDEKLTDLMKTLTAKQAYEHL